MADCLMKNIRKKTGRAKESILETFGKADKTTDEHFEELNADFTKQHKNAEKLQNQLKTYEMSMRVANQALRGFNDAIREIYEPDWGASEHIKALTRQNEMVWDQFLDRLHEETTVPVMVYAAQFPDVKTKIAKRGRKLVDYDGARHNLTAAQNSPKKTDEKVQKAKEQLTSAKKLYEDLNGELIAELPELYESRTPFIVNNLHSFYNLHTRFLNETAKLCDDIRDQIKIDTTKTSPSTKTAAVVAAKSYDLVNSTAAYLDDPSPKSAAAENGSVKLLKYTPSPVFVETRDSSMFKEQQQLNFNPTATPSPSPTTPPTKQENSPRLEPPVRLHEHAHNKQTQPPSITIAEANQEHSDLINYNKTNESSPMLQQTTLPAAVSERGSLYLDANDQLKDEVVAKKVVDDGKVINVTYTVLHKVRATHSYAAEDTDELSFEIGDIIAVIPYVDEDDVDEGWAMGVKETTGEKGVFPMNFTKNM